MPLAQKILLLGSDPLVNTLITASIHSHPEWREASVDIYTQVARAMAELSVNDYQAVLIDCPSFNVSPLELVIQFKAALKQTPLVLINRPGMEKMAIQCLKNGADYYLLKHKNWEEEIPHVLETVIEEEYRKNKLRRKISQLEEEVKQLKKNATLDDSTLFYTTEHFQTLLSRELKRAARYGLNLACLIMDVQCDKENQSDPSAKTPLLYEQLALVLKSVVRASDIWARLSDNRFAAILPHTTAKEAKSAQKRIESEISGTHFSLEEKQIPLKIKWGITPFDRNKVKDENQFFSLLESSVGPRLAS